jgi:hypothetical protein
MSNQEELINEEMEKNKILSNYEQLQRAVKLISEKIGELNIDLREHE